MENINIQLLKLGEDAQNVSVPVNENGEATLQDLVNVTGIEGASFTNFSDRTSLDMGSVLSNNMRILQGENMRSGY